MLNSNQITRGIYSMNGARTIEELQSRMDRYCLICSFRNDSNDDCESCHINRFFNKKIKTLEKRVTAKAKG